MILAQVKHEFIFDLELTYTSVDETRCYRCSHCGVWTSQEGLLERCGEVCSKRDRRKAERRLRPTRRGVLQPSREYSL